MDIQEYIQSGIIESYVLGLADAEEVAALEQMRSVHPEINAAILEFESQLEANARENAVPLPPVFRQQVLQSLKPQTSPVQSAGKRKVLLFPKSLVAAAAILIVISIGYNIYAYQKVKTLEKENKELALQQTALYSKNNALQTRSDELMANLQFLSDPASVRIELSALKEQKTTKAIVIWNRTSKEVRLVMQGLPTPPPDKQYQLWALVDGTPVDAGVIGNCATMCTLKNIEKAQAFAITLEKAGGSPTPTLEQLQAMGKVPG
ncbi:MAG TPA: anti-sigma factor [Niabella sp.]